MKLKIVILILVIQRIMP